MSNWLRDIILRRRIAYRNTFMPGGQLTTATGDVLADLRKFCRATSTPAVVSPTTQMVDPIATGIVIGRLEVWHRISSHLHLSDADVYRFMEQQQAQEQDH